MTTRSTAATLAGLVVASLALGGCAGAAATARTPSPGSLGLLRDYIGVLNGEQTQAERAAQDAEVEQVIAQCMAEQGFDYLPQSNDDPFYRPDEWLPDDPDWVASWGFGLVDFPGKRQMVAAQAAGNENTAYYDSLGASEQAAYSEILYGPAPSDSQIAASLDGSEPITWEQQGCYGRGHHEVRGDDPLQTDEFGPLREAITAFQASQFEAPEYADLDAAWSDCMASAGHDGFERQGAAAESISQRMSDIYFSQTESDEDDPRLLALHDEEVELALADLECREETDYRARAQAIQDAQEQQFIEDHRSEFDALRAAVEQGG